MSMRRKTIAALFAVSATALTAALLFGFDPGFKPMLAPRTGDLIWLFAAALLGHIALAEWRASRPGAKTGAMMPANDDKQSHSGASHRVSSASRRAVPTSASRADPRLFDFRREQASVEPVDCDVGAATGFALRSDEENAIVAQAPRATGTG